MTTISEATTAARFVGHSVRRLEDPRLLTGRGRYVDDVEVPGTLHAAFVRSEVARARIVRLDVAAARAVPGVEAVYTGEDLNPLTKQQIWSTELGRPVELGGELPYPPAKPLAGDDVRYVGDPIAIVIAESRYVAEDAAELVEVEIDPQSPVLDYATAAADVEVVHPELGSNLVAVPVCEAEEFDEILSGADHVFTRTFTQARVTNVPMEPRGLVVEYDVHRAQMEIRATTQSVHEVKSGAARLTGLPESRIRCVAEDVGGGCGQKGFLRQEEAAVIMAAFALGNRPVKWIEDRRENLMASCQSRNESVDVTFALDANGHIVAAKTEFHEDIGAYPYAQAPGVTMLAARMFPAPYKIPVYTATCIAYNTNTAGKGSYRGPWAIETTAREQMMDYVAGRLGKDPIEFRRVNTIRAEDLPFTAPAGNVYDVITPLETLEQAVEMIDVAAFRKDQEAALAEGRLLGLGISGYVEPSGAAAGWGVMGTEPAVIQMDVSGKVQIRLSVLSNGQGVETTIAQIVAEHLGCHLGDVTVVQGDSASTPVGVGSGASRSAVMTGGAAQTAAIQLRDKMVAIAAELLEANPDDLEVVNSTVSVRGTPDAGISFEDIAWTAHAEAAKLPTGMDGGLEIVARYASTSEFTWSNSTQACTVEVDRDTGLVVIRRFVVSEDCGTMINPMIVEGQIAGGVVQGIGMALLEHMAYDDDGNPLATTFLDYLLPTSQEIPDLEYGHIETPSDRLGGYKGMGEGGMVGAPAAVANAVNDALAQIGATPMTEFPFTPTRILDAINAAS